MNSKKTVIGLTAGVAAGMTVGFAIGMIAKSMTSSKSCMKKKISCALGSVGDFFESLSKFTS